MFAQEPHLQFISAEYVAYDKIISSIVAKGRSTPRKWPYLLNDDLMRVDQSL
jgi:hypothetical protein